NVIPAQESWEQNRSFETIARRAWDDEVSEPASHRSFQALNLIDALRLYTTISNPALRREFCAKFLKLYPGDVDNGCPADRRPPATIVTQDGDVPLAGEWPR